MTERGRNWNSDGHMDKYINCEEVFTMSSVDLRVATLQGQGMSEGAYGWVFLREQLVLVEVAK